VNDHRDESLLDKIKNAFGMGDDGTDASPDDVRDDVPATATATAPAVNPSAPQAEAEFSEPFEEDLGDPVNRPAGPDYGASDSAAAEPRVDETMEGTAATDAGVPTAPAGYDDPYETVAGPGPMGAGTTAEDQAWTRGEAASGTTPFDGDERRNDEVIEPERRETGV
jgi:hypothetical protein